MNINFNTLDVVRRDDGLIILRFDGGLLELPLLMRPDVVQELIGRLQEALSATEPARWRIAKFAKGDGK
jgi:hypothetical protein